MKAFLALASVGLLFAAVLPVGGCKANPAATAACKGQTGSKYACNNCCKSNGASAHSFVQGSSCECLN
jgi:hypothetical protein